MTVSVRADKQSSGALLPFVTLSHSETGCYNVMWQRNVLKRGSVLLLVTFLRTLSDNIQLFCLLGYYAAQDNLKPTFRDYLSVPSSRVKLLVCVCHPNPVRMLNCQMRITALPQLSTTQFKLSTNWFFYLRKALPTCPREFPKSDSSEMTTQRIPLRYFKCRRTLAFNLVQERQLCS